MMLIWFFLKKNKYLVVISNRTFIHIYTQMHYFTWDDMNDCYCQYVEIWSDRRTFFKIMKKRLILLCGSSLPVTLPLICFSSLFLTFTHTHTPSHTHVHKHKQTFCPLGQRVRQSPVGGHFFTRHFALGVMAPFDKWIVQKEGEGGRNSEKESWGRKISNRLNG